MIDNLELLSAIDVTSNGDGSGWDAKGRPGTGTVEGVLKPKEEACGWTVVDSAIRETPESGGFVL